MRTWNHANTNGFTALLSETFEIRMEGLLTAARFGALARYLFACGNEFKIICTHIGIPGGRWEGGAIPSMSTT